jgi:hypothetical protein
LLDSYEMECKESVVDCSLFTFLDAINSGVFINRQCEVGAIYVFCFPTASFVGPATYLEWAEAGQID